MGAKHQLSDVFNESQVPTITFVEPKEFADLVGSLRTAGKHVTLCGPSGCGKTTLARKALAKARFGPGQQHWVSGRDHTAARSVEDVFAQEFSCSTDVDELHGWMVAAGIIVVDDFHHLPRVVRDTVGRALKRWHELGIRCFIIGIAESAHHLLEIDPELGIRNDPYEMKSQDDAFVDKLIGLGESALNISFDADTRASFVKASRGVPSVTHVLCRVACVRHEVHETCEAEKSVRTSLDDIKDSVLRTYRGKYQSKVIGLAKGKQRARSVHNTYFQIIKNLCLMDRSEIDTDELRRRIVGAEPDPGVRNRLNTSFHNCLKNISDVIAERGLEDAIYYDNGSKTISIEDPSFRFYLTLMDLDELAKQVTVRSETYPYDVAISFAGEQRPLAKQLRDELVIKGYNVFYDFDEQHLLWGQNLREKLADVYSHDAFYMVVLLSKSYPEKDWPAFELEIGRAAKRDRASDYLLPIIVDDVAVVGLSGDVGHMDLRKRPIQEIADILSQKIEAS